MRAMVLTAPGSSLRPITVDVPTPASGQVLVQVHVCGVCRTDLHVVDGDLPHARCPIVPGHEIVGTVVECGPDVDDLRVGDRVGIPWLASACGRCRFCTAGRENLCDNAQFTGYTVDGGYADYAMANARFCFRLPDDFTDEELAPWLCAGFIGHRALRIAGDGARLGIYGFGASAQIVAQLARHAGREVFAFTRPGDDAAQFEATRLGASWSGGSDERSPAELDAAILFAPVGSLVPKALRDVGKGGTVVCAGIHMSDIPAFPYEILWGERRVCSVANLTRRDGDEFIALARSIPVRTRVVTFALGDANEALAGLRDGRLAATAVLTMT
jgi:propanol-preferring alcohol dehydrogenase